MGKARVAQEEAERRLRAEEGQTAREPFWQAISAGAGPGALPLLGLSSFTGNAWGPGKPDILGKVLYYSIY